MTDITLVRHSRSTDNEAGIFGSSRRDASLSEEGRKLALEQARTVDACPDAIYTSNLQRAHQTALIYAGTLKEKFDKDVPVIILKSLKAQDCGNLEGLSYASETFQQLERAPGGLMNAETGDYNGENRQKAIQRQEAGFLGVLFSAAAKNYKNVFVVTHTDTIERFMQGMAIGFDWKTLKNCQHLGPFSGRDVHQKLLRRQAGYIAQRTGKTPGFAS